MTTHKPAIRVSRLTIRFGEKIPFKDFSLEIAKGERVILTGESGTGKSTFLKCLLGVSVPERGEIVIDGIPLNAATVWELRHRLAYVPQEPELGDGTLKEWMEHPFTYRANAHLRKNLTRLPEIFDRLSLPGDLLGARIETLSGGEKQRAALASALLLDRDILLLDEPTSALDKKNSLAVTELLSSLKGVTLVGVSHDPNFMTLADRVIPFPVVEET